MARNNGRRGFLQSAMDGLIAARTKQVNRYVNGALLMLDDETLKANGYSRDELRKRDIGYMI